MTKKMEPILNLNNPSRFDQSINEKEETNGISNNENERKIKYKKDYYIQKRISARWHYFLNCYLFITLGILGVLILLGIIFILPYLDSIGEIGEAFQAGLDYIKTTGVQNIAG